MKLPPGFEYRPDWLDAPDEWFRMLHEGLEWAARDILLFGRRVAQPRLVDWYADPGIRYRYSGLELRAKPWPPFLEELRRRAGETASRSFNSALCNLYRDGADSMGWHADDEQELGPEPVIASISLGAERRFLIRPRGGGKSIRLELSPGSLLVMSGRSQVDYQHSLPKTRRPVDPRINLTFREVLSPPG